MTEQLWGIGGVVLGIMATGGTSWIVDRAKHKREASEVASIENRALCQTFLEKIEKDLKWVDSYQEQHGVFPGDDGYEPVPVVARDHLTEIELKCPKKVHVKATALAVATEQWIWSGGTLESYTEARALFIAAIRKDL